MLKHSLHHDQLILHRQLQEMQHDRSRSQDYFSPYANKRIIAVTCYTIIALRALGTQHAGIHWQAGIGCRVHPLRNANDAIKSIIAILGESHRDPIGTNGQ